MALDAVIFDMDGVLLDSEPLHHAVVNALLAEESVPPLSDASYRRYLGSTDLDMWRDLLARFPLRGELAAYRARYDVDMRAAYRARSILAPGAAHALDVLGARGVALGLGSGSRRAWVETALETMGITQRFGAIVCGDEVQAGKPDPEIFRRVADALDRPAARCLVVEDSPKGIAAARAAGMRVIAVRTAYVSDADLAGADRIVDGLPAVDWEALARAGDHAVAGPASSTPSPGAA